MANVITIDWPMVALLLVLEGTALVFAVLVYILNKVISRKTFDEVEK